MVAKITKHLLGIAAAMVFLWGAGFVYLLATSGMWADEGLKAAVCLALAGAIVALRARR